jgi:hypothetical protein
MTIPTYDTKNGVKPRFDNGGSEFGLAHRDLGAGYLMFDIDRMSAVIEVDLELKRKETGFVEYRNNKGIMFIALFEIKAKKTEYSLQAMNPLISNTMATIEMARKLECRLFVVYGTENKQPFEFYEYFPDKNEFIYSGTLDYNSDNRTENIKEFWTNVLNIRR